ncbi:helix-turn-helix domain-containing protein [Corynebacterium sp.]|uniref:helix-turn-helix domain-containing protein n=2 Tax=Corynebacterium sp. TaxID=1720 RepID=UPI0037C1018E
MRCSRIGCGGGSGMNRREAEDFIFRRLDCPPKLVLSVAEVAAVTGESDKTIRRRVDAGEIRSSTQRDCRNIRIPLSEVLRYCMV